MISTIVQWDSWRFWESLAAGCVTFHLDFDKYGLDIPVMPENWRHYIGIDLDNVPAAIDRIVDEPEILEKIALEGRRWAIENYSPVPTALRFLETIYQQPLSLKNQFNNLLKF
ncbi:glycosyltransferase [Sphaerospermopsis sp. FACHB-1194]|uniref:glycosyltransferase n=1 Tax=Sphaerospermopsis sp. FACHB-1194 TaxID=2692862 RepID=UPI00322088A4